ERRHRLTLDLVWSADDGRFGDARMIDQRTLDFHRADTVPRDIQHIVNAAEQPEEPVLIAFRAVAGEVHIRRPAAPVLSHIALRITVDAAQHRRPWTRQREEPAASAGDRIALLGFDLRLDARKRSRRRARLRRRESWQRRDHDRASLRLPPGVDDRAALTANVAVVPDPRFRVDRLHL